MKKTLFLCSLITIVLFSQPSFATNETLASGNEETTDEVVSVSPKATSQASIGFSTKNIKGDSTTPTVPKNTEGTTKPSGRLPSTGETLGMGISILGLLFILIVFRKELKAMIENKKNKSRENV